jgi:hypothetical protein
VGLQPWHTLLSVPGEPEEATTPLFGRTLPAAQPVRYSNGWSRAPAAHVDYLVAQSKVASTGALVGMYQHAIASRPRALPGVAEAMAGPEQPYEEVEVSGTSG